LLYTEIRIYALKQTKVFLVKEINSYLGMINNAMGLEYHGEKSKADAKKFN